MDKMKKYLLPVICVALFGEIYFNPINSGLRISAGIIALNLIVLITDDISVFYTSVFSGACVFILRTIIAIGFTNISPVDAISYNLPSLAYYLAYGAIMLLLHIRRHKEHFFTAILLLALTDSMSNILEVLIRDKTINYNIIRVFILIGLVRSVTAFFVYYLYKKQELFILSQEHQKRYSQLNILISDIQAEMFYLKKSMGDIEKVMSKSYKLYEKHKENKELQEDTLDIAREVHEIKKEYHRVLSGFQSFLNGFENNEVMALKDMLSIIKANTKRFLSEQDKKIFVHFDFQDNFQFKKYYNLFTIVNNLIINAIEACGGNGAIEVWEKSDEAGIYFGVKDNGEGIDNDILPYIFNPGFTTKYYDDGEASTGIGLAHVKNIVDELEGSIKVESIHDIGTVFEIRIPKKSLLE